MREEIQQDKDWVIRLRTLPDAPETFYLMPLMASHDFQTALQNYLDLEDLRKKLVAWQKSLDAFEDMIRAAARVLRAAAARDRSRSSASSMRRSACASSSAITSTQRLQHMLIAPRPDYLATADEQRAAARASSALEAALARRERRRAGRAAAAHPAPEGRAHLDAGARTITSA